MLDKEGGFTSWLSSQASSTLGSPGTLMTRKPVLSSKELLLATHWWNNPHLLFLAGISAKAIGDAVQSSRVASGRWRVPRVWLYWYTLLSSFPASEASLQASSVTKEPKA